MFTSVRRFSGEASGDVQHQVRLSGHANLTHTGRTARGALGWPVRGRHGRGNVGKKCRADVQPRRIKNSETSASENASAKPGTVYFLKSKSRMQSHRLLENQCPNQSVLLELISRLFCHKCLLVHSQLLIVFILFRDVASRH